MPGVLIVCAGPIGNLGDAPPRLGDALASADVVYAEDTRRARTLLDRLGVKATLVSYFAGNEDRRQDEIARRLTDGETVAVLTDAGTPGVSDPGLTAVRAAVSVGARVTGVPGPSAVTLAIALAGLPADRFVFEGFLPRKGLARRQRLGEIATEPRTVVLFCAAPRLAEDLIDLLGAMDGERQCVVLREMTKIHEEVWRGSLAEATGHWSALAARGEVTVVLGPMVTAEPSIDGALERVEALVAAGTKRSDAVKQAAVETGVSRRRLYELAIAPPNGE